MALTLDLDAELAGPVAQSVAVKDLPESVAVDPDVKAQTSTALAKLEERAVNPAAAKPVVADPLAPPAEDHLLNCRGMLSPAALQQAQARAAQDLPRLLKDPNLLGEYGNQTVGPLNALARRLLDEVGKEANIPEITQITKGLDDRMRGLTGKYDRKTLAKTRKDYDRISGSVKAFFNKFRDMLAMLIRDAKGVQAYLDSIEATLEDLKKKLRHNIQICNEVYDENEKAIGKLISAIAVMECIREQAAAYALTIDVTGGGDTLKARVAREQREQVIEFIQNLDVRISEFQQRLMVAFATGPQVRNIRAISYGLAQRLTLLQILTIPVWRLVIVEWVALERANQSKEAVQAVSDTNNLALSAFAAVGEKIVGEAAEVIQKPTTDPETIIAVADSLAKQAAAMTVAYQHGIEARQKVSVAIVQGARMIAQAEDVRADKVLALVQQADAASAEVSGPMNPDELPDFLSQNATSVLTQGRLAVPNVPSVDAA